MKRSPQIPVRGAERREGRRCSTSRLDIDNRHAAVDCERRKAPRIPSDALKPETPQACVWTGLSAHRLSAAQNKTPATWSPAQFFSRPAASGKRSP